MDDIQSNEQVDSPEPETAVGNRTERMVIWGQFPRRIILLLIAFGLASAVVVGLREPLLTDPLLLGTEVDWSISLTSQRPVDELVGERMPNTLLLLGIAIVLSLIFAAALTLLAIAIHTLESRVGVVGSILKGLGRLLIFGDLTPPAVVVAILLLFIFALQLQLFPVTGLGQPGSSISLGDRLRGLFLPALSLSLLPTLFTAQAATRSLTLTYSQPLPRRRLAGVFAGLHVLLGQIGGLLSGAIVVELVFGLPGLGRLLIESALSRDTPLLLGVIGAMFGLILAGRLGAEFFGWLERLIQGADRHIQLDASAWRKKARIIWVVLTLLLLLIPIAFVGAGLLTDPDAALELNMPDRNAPPSAEHPLGVDQLGRDLQSRVLRGGIVPLTAAFIAAIIVLLPAVLIGALSGFLASRRVLWAESIADIILLPVDLFLFFPAVPAIVVLSVLLGELGTASIGIIAAVILLPRAVRVAHTLWLSMPCERSKVLLGSAGLGAIFLGTLFAAFGLTVTLNFLGVGVPPPTPTLGAILNEGLAFLRIQSIGVVATAVIIWLCAFAFYTAADGLTGFFTSKKVLARLNE